MITITHKEISSTTAERMGKDYTAELVSNVVNEYAKTTAYLGSKKGPNDPKEKTLIETPLAGFEITYHEKRTKKTPDGGEIDLGPGRKAKVAIPKSFLTGINADFVKLVAGVVGAVAENITANKKSA